MRFAIFRTAAALQAAPTTFAVTTSARTMADLAAVGIAGERRCLRFGDRYLVCSPDSATRTAMVGPHTGFALEREDSLAVGQLETLHLVTQQGRLFQQQHPEVPVLLDAGRHLAVSLSPHRAREIAASDPTSFSIAAVTADDDVFAECPCPSPRPQPDPEILEIVDRLSRLALQADVTTLATYPTRNSVTAHYRDAAEWAAGRFAALGYEVSRWRFNMAEDKRTPPGRCLNIVAEKTGTGAGERGLVIVCAHLDSVNAEAAKSEVATAPAPGADDNASSCAGVLEMARAFHAIKTTHDLRFILFGGEEQGLIGSKRYSSDLSIKDRKRVVAVVNMDMIGVDNEAQKPPAVLLEGGPVSKVLIAELCHAAHAYTELVVNTTLKPWNSDHVSFLEQGIAAVLTIEGYDTSNEDIHHPSDTLDRVDTELAVEILRMNTAFVAGKLGIAKHHA